MHYHIKLFPYFIHQEYEAIEEHLFSTVANSNYHNVLLSAMIVSSVRLLLKGNKHLMSPNQGTNISTFIYSSLISFNLQANKQTVSCKKKSWPTGSSHVPSTRTSKQAKRILKCTTSDNRVFQVKLLILCVCV